MTENELVREVIERANDREDARSILCDMTPPGPGGVGAANARTVKRRMELLDLMIARDAASSVRGGYSGSPDLPAGYC